MTEEREIVFLGGLFPREKRQEISSRSRGNIQYAADALQWNIVNGLEKNLHRALKLLNAVFIGAYPGLYRDSCVKTYDFSHVPGAKDRNIGFLNMPVIKHISRAIHTRREVVRWAGKKDHEKVLLVYSVHTPFLYACAAAKRVNPGLHVCLIVPDLPEYMDLGTKRSFLRRVFKCADRALAGHYLSSVDSFALLTEHMAEKLPVGNRPYTVIEGMVEADAEPEPEDVSGTERTLLYTGTLSKAYGIDVLLKAFGLTACSNYRLLLCGDGEAVPEIAVHAQKDGRIRYLGVLARDEALALQRSAVALINPRNAENEFTKYSFPSKNMEYLLAGRPVIAYKLPGIPDEYDEYIRYIDGNSPEAMACAISDVLNCDAGALNAFGQKARQFVLEHKNNVLQTGRLLELIQGRSGQTL